MYGLNFMCGHKASTNRVVKGSLEWKDVWHNLAKDEWRKDGRRIERESVSCEPVSLSLSLYYILCIWTCIPLSLFEIISKNIPRCKWLTRLGVIGFWSARCEFKSFLRQVLYGKFFSSTYNSGAEHSSVVVSRGWKFESYIYLIRFWQRFIS